MTGFSGPGPYGGGPPGRPGPGYGPYVGGPQQSGAPGQFRSPGPYGPPRQPSPPRQPGPGQQPYPGAPAPYGAAQPFGPAQQVPYGSGPGQYPPGPPPKRARGALWLGLGIGAGLIVLVVTLVLVFVGDDGSSPSQQTAAPNSTAPNSTAQNSTAQDSAAQKDDASYQEAFVQEFVVNSTTFSPGNMTRYQQAVDAYCDDSPDKANAERGLTALEQRQVSSQTLGTPSVEVKSEEATSDRIPVEYSVNVTTNSKSGTLTGTVYVRPGAGRCVIEVVEDESGSGPTQTF